MTLFGISSQALFGQLLLGLINGSFYAVLSLGLAVIFGLLNIINFSHGALYMIGAFVSLLSESEPHDAATRPNAATRAIAAKCLLLRMLSPPWSVD